MSLRFGDARDPKVSDDVRLLSRRDLTDGAKIVWGYLRWRQGDNAAAWPSLTRICEDTGRSRDAAVRALRELVDAGLVERRQRDGRSVEYQVRAPDQSGNPTGPTSPETRPVQDRDRSGKWTATSPISGEQTSPISRLEPLQVTPSGTPSEASGLAPDLVSRLEAVLGEQQGRRAARILSHADGVAVQVAETVIARVESGTRIDSIDRYVQNLVRRARAGEELTTSPRARRGRQARVPDWGGEDVPSIDDPTEAPP